MRGLSRRIKVAERKAVLAGITDFTGWSEERMLMEMHRMLLIAYSGTAGDPAPSIYQLLEASSFEEFQRVWAAKQKRDLEANWHPCQRPQIVSTDRDSETEIPPEIALRLEDFIAAGVLVNP